MARSIIFGKYIPGASPVHRMDPRMKLTGVLVAMVVILTANTYPALAVAAAFIAALMASTDCFCGSATPPCSV